MNGCGQRHNDLYCTGPAGHEGDHLFGPVKSESLVAKIDSVRSWLTTQQPELEKLLTPQGMNTVRYNRMVVTVCLRNPKLAECTRASLALSVMEAAALGLEIDSVSGLAYLVPFKGVATLIVGYRGMIQLAYRHPKVIAMGAEAVFDKDHFEYEEGLRPRLVHRPAPPSAGPRTWETLIGCYATATIRGGGHPFKFMWKEEIDEHRKRSRARDDGPWVTDTIAMAKKTPVRTLTKFIPQSPQLMQALAVDGDPEMEPAPGDPPVPHGTPVEGILDAIGGAADA